MFIVFYRTNDVFEAEEILRDANVRTEIAPTPVQDKAYCGVCIQVKGEDIDKALKCLQAMDYKTINT